MDDLRTRAELLRMKADLLINLGVEVRDMAADLARHATGPSAPPREPEPVDVSDLMPHARRAAAELVAAGMRVHQSAIATRLRQYGHKVSNDRAKEMWRLLTAEGVPMPPPGSVARPADPIPLPVLSDIPAPQASLNGHQT